MSRIQKLENIYQEQLIKHQVDNVSDFIQSVVNVDVTKGKYARFLIEAFLNDKFLGEDLIGGLDSTVGHAISLFDKHKGKLPVNERSVYALDKETQIPLYQSPGDLWNSVKQFQGELSGKELKKEEQEKIYRETEFIYKDEETGFQIISPLTEESAKWWGKGTRWCTSADNNNRFEHYAKQAPLLILLIPNNGDTTGNRDKLQLWKYDNYIQFMDESDNNVSLEYIEKNWRFLEPICMWLKALQYIPNKYITQESYEIAIKQDAFALMYIPEELRTKKMCELVIKQDGWILQYIPEHLRTKELCLEAVQSNGNALCYIPEEYKTPYLCEIAVKQNGEALNYISEELRTQEMCKIAVQNNGDALSYVPEKLKTIEICKLAVKQNGLTLSYISKELRTKELYKLAVQSNGLAIMFIPKEYRTKELCELAIKSDGRSLGYVPEKFITKELCEMAVKQNGCALAYVPYQWKDEIKHYVIDEVFELPIEQYQKTFQEIKTLFPKKDISLSYHNS